MNSIYPKKLFVKNSKRLHVLNERHRGKLPGKNNNFLVCFGSASNQGCKREKIHQQTEKWDSQVRPLRFPVGMIGPGWCFIVNMRIKQTLTGRGCRGLAPTVKLKFLDYHYHDWPHLTPTSCGFTPGFFRPISFIVLQLWVAISLDFRNLLPLDQLKIFPSISQPLFFLQIPSKGGLVKASIPILIT